MDRISCDKCYVMPRATPKMHTATHSHRHVEKWSSQGLNCWLSKEIHSIRAGLFWTPWPKYFRFDILHWWQKVTKLLGTSPMLYCGLWCNKMHPFPLKRRINKKSKPLATILGTGVPRFRDFHTYHPNSFSALLSVAKLLRALIASVFQYIVNYISQIIITKTRWSWEHWDLSRRYYSTLGEICRPKSKVMSTLTRSELPISVTNRGLAIQEE